MNETYQMLMRAEQAVNAVWPYIIEKSTAEIELERCKAESKSNYSNYKPGIIMHKICIPVAIVCIIVAFILPRGLFGSLSLGSVMALTFGGVALVFVLIGAILKSTYGKKYEESENKIPIIEQRITDAQVRLDDAKNRNRDGLAVAQKLLPKEAIDPAHIRTVMSYFETGRATNMTEALPLIEQQLHREKMEQLQREQISATEAATEALRRARYYD